MLAIDVRKALGVTQISDKYPELWDKLQKFVDNPPDWATPVDSGLFAGKDGVLFDFKDVVLTRPWNSENFKLFFANPRVHMRVYTSEHIKNTIDTMCRIGGLPDNRVENIDIMRDLPKKENPADVRVKRLTELVYPVIETIPGFGGTEYWGKVSMDKAVSQLNVNDSSKAIEAAIRRHAKENGLKKYRINLGKIVANYVVIQEISEMALRMNKEGFDITVASSDAKATERIRLWMSSTASMDYPDKQRLQILLDTTPVGFVGMLTRYKKTVRRDEFGRSGDGEVVACQPAIFLGVKGDDEHGHIALFRQFFLKTFMPKIHWAMDNDGGEHPGLEDRMLEIPLCDLGIHGMFMGRYYHFREPNLQQLGDVVTTYALDKVATTITIDGQGAPGGQDGAKEDGEEAVDTYKVRLVKLSLPEHIKATLDDFGIEYNKECLETSIRESRVVLQKLLALQKSGGPSIK